MLVIMVEKMVNDLRLFIELFSLIMVGFALAFIGLTQWHTYAESPQPPLGSSHLADFAASFQAGPLGGAHALGGGGGGGGGFGLARRLAADEVEARSGPWAAVMVALWATYGEIDLDFFYEQVPPT